MKITTILLFFAISFQPWTAHAGFIKKTVEKKLTPKPNSPTPASISVNNPDILADKDSYEQCRAQVLPSFISNSMGWMVDEGVRKKYGVEGKLMKLPILGEIGKKQKTGVSAYNGLKALSPPSIIVTSAGNEHPAPVTSIKTKASKDFDAIIVGSLSPSGWKSSFSREGEAVHIMAPSDYYITSANDDGAYRKFGGTSGAAPLVTAGLAGFEWMAGYHPTAKEAKILLEKTAIPTPHSHTKPRKNGVGMLNSYKLAMVGKELKRLCGRDISCFKRMIQNPSVYEFPLDPGLFKAVDQAFPNCSSTCGGTVESCVNKAAVFKRLRKASFLNPSNKKLWTYLSCIYDEGGFKTEAKAMLTTYKTLLGPPEKDGRPAHKSCQSDSDCVLVPYCSKKSKPEAGKTDSSNSKPRFSEVGNAVGPQVSLSGYEGLRAMTRASAEIHYATSPCKQDRCNGKCRCDKVEEKLPNTLPVIGVYCDKSSGRCDRVEERPPGVTISSKCIRSRCVAVRKPLPPESFPISEMEPLPPDSPAQESDSGFWEGGSGTR